MCNVIHSVNKYTDSFRFLKSTYTYYIVILGETLSGYKFHRGPDSLNSKKIIHLSERAGRLLDVSCCLCSLWAKLQEQKIDQWLPGVKDGGLLIDCKGHELCI
jgi:hypothetical protein